MIPISIVLVSFTLSLAILDDYPPPGTVELTDSTYIDRTVITNLDWKEYVTSRNSKNDIYFMPDTTLIIGHKNYYNHKKFKNCPMIGLNDLSISAYCKWRGEFVTQNLIDYNSNQLCNSSFYNYNSGKNISVFYRQANEDEIVEAKRLDLFQDRKLKKRISNLIGKDYLRCIAVMVQKQNSN